MAGEYTVKILGSEEFNKLPFKRIQESPGSVYGAADVNTKTAYVLDTGFNDFTKANISHELDELMAGVSPHEEDGIRYKSLGDMFGSIGGGIKSGASALGRGVKNIFTPGPAAPTGGGNLFSAPPIGGSGAADAGSFGNVLGQNLPGFQKTGGSQLLPFGNTGGGVAASNAAPGIFDSLFQSSGAPKGSVGTNLMPNLTTPFPGFTPSSAASRADTSGGGGTDTSVGGFDLGNIGQDLMTSAGKAAPGALVSMLGNLFAPKAEAPDYSGIKSDLASRIGEGGSPAFDLGFGEAERQLSGEPGTIPPAVLAEIDLRRDEEIRALEDRFRANQQSGGMSESDTSRFGELRADIVKKFEALKQQTEFEYQGQQENRRMTTMSTLLNLDQAQYEQYASLANLDVAELVTQYGIDVQTATDFKELFGNVGGQMIEGALNPQTA